MTLTDYLQGIADAIRAKDGTSDVINAQEFAERILAIPSGDDLPFDVKYGTLTLANDFAAYVADDGSVSRPFTLPHGMDVKPDMFIMWDTYTEGTNPLSTLVYAYRFPDVRRFNVYPSHTSNAERINSSSGTSQVVGTTMVDETNVTVYCNKDNYLIVRAGHTYKWIAIGGL